MKIELKKNYKPFCSIIKLIKDINIEGTINFNKDSIFIKIFDMSKVILANITIQKDFFDLYDVKEPISFDVDFEIIGRIINSMKKGCSIEDINDELIFKTSTIRRAVKKYVVNKKERSGLPTNHNYNCKVNVDKFLKELGIILEVGHVMKIECGKDKFKMFTKRDLETVDIDSETIEYIKGDDTLVWIGSGFLGKIKNLSGTFKNITFAIDEKYPFYIKGEQDDIEIKIWIALREENTDD